MKKRPHHKIEIKLREISQLFNSMDPSPFHEKDLDHDAEEFLVSWVHEYPWEDPVSLVVHVSQLPEEPEAKSLVEQAIHNYFAYRARLNWLEFKRLLQHGRTSLIIGLLFLSACLFGSEMLRNEPAGTFWGILRESLTIGGWVAMWRPMEIYLYEWWPLRRRGLLYEKMSRMHVELKKREEHHSRVDGAITLHSPDGVARSRLPGETVPAATTGQSALSGSTLPLRP